MKKLLILFSVLFALGASAQTLTISGTITDSTAQNWNGCTWTANLTQPAYYNGTPVSSSQFTGACDSSGVFTSTGQFYNTTTLSPTSTMYEVTVCSQTSAQCSVITTPVITGSQLISTLNAQIVTPKFPAIPAAYGYSDSEVWPIPLAGGAYWNTTLDSYRVWTGATWITSGGVSGGAVLLSPAGTQTITQPVNTNFNLATSGTGLFESNGQPVLTTASAGHGLTANPTTISNTTVNYSAAPSDGYQMPPLDGLYYSTLTVANIPGATGLSNVSVNYVNASNTVVGTATGVGATTAGTTGIGFIPFPQPIDPTQPFRANVHFCLGSSTTTPDSNQLIMRIGSPTDVGYGSAETFVTSQSSMTGLTGPTLGSILMMNGWGAYGSQPGIPSGTCGTMMISTLGNGAAALDAYGNAYIWEGYIPDNPIMLGAENSTTGLVNYTNIPVVYEATVNAAALANAEGIVINDASSNSIVTGVYVSQGRLDGPTDGLMPTPSFVSPIVLDDASLGTYPSATRTARAELWIPPNYGSPQGNSIVEGFNPNGTLFATNYTCIGPCTANGTATAVFANLFNAGYIVEGVAGSPNPNNYNTTATISNWNGPTGNQYRSSLVGLTRQILPNSNQLFRFAMSMGGLDALGDEMLHPGGAGIAMFAPAVNLYGSYTFTGPAPYGEYTPCVSCITGGFSSWYQSISSTNTGNTPGSSPSDWILVGPSLTGLPLGYMSPGLFPNLGTYSSSTTYGLNDVVAMPFTGTISQLSPFDPTQNFSLFSRIPMESWIEVQDSNVPIGWVQNFAAGATAAGNPHATVNALTDCTASASLTCHLSTGDFNPTLTVTPWNTTTNPSPTLTFFNTYNTPFPTVTGAFPPALAVGGADKPHNYATIAAVSGATAIPVQPCTAFRCRITFTGGTATTGSILTAAWPLGTFSRIPECIAVESANTTLHGISAGGESLTGVTVSSAVTVAGASFTVELSCPKP